MLLGWRQFGILPWASLRRSGTAAAQVTGLV
jgi:hypothetical protein